VFSLALCPESSLQTVQNKEILILIDSVEHWLLQRDHVIKISVLIYLSTTFPQFDIEILHQMYLQFSEMTRICNLRLQSWLPILYPLMLHECLEWYNHELNVPCQSITSAWREQPRTRQDGSQEDSNRRMMHVKNLLVNSRLQKKKLCWTDYCLIDLWANILIITFYTCISVCTVLLCLNNLQQYHAEVELTWVW